MNTPDDMRVARREIDEETLGPPGEDAVSPKELFGPDLSEAIRIGETLHSRKAKRDQSRQA